MHTYGMHYHDTNHRHMNLVHTVKQTSEGYSHKNICNAKIYHELHTKVGHTSTHDLKASLSTNHIINCPVAVSDIDHAKTIFWPRIPILKVTTTRQATEEVISYYVAIPPSTLQDNNNFTLFGEIFFVNQIFVLCNGLWSPQIYHIRAYPQPENGKITTAIQHVKSIYSALGFNITTILMDG